MSITAQDIENIFTYHKPFGTQSDRYEAIRLIAKELAMTMIEQCPDSRELSLAVTHLQNSVMWANASIALNERNHIQGNKSSSSWRKGYRK